MLSTEGITRRAAILGPLAAVASEIGGTASANAQTPNETFEDKKNRQIKKIKLFLDNLPTQSTDLFKYVLDNLWDKNAGEDLLELIGLRFDDLEYSYQLKTIEFVNKLIIDLGEADKSNSGFFLLEINKKLIDVVNVLLFAFARSTKVVDETMQTLLLKHKSLVMQIAGPIMYSNYLSILELVKSAHTKIDVEQIVLDLENILTNKRITTFNAIAGLAGILKFLEKIDGINDRLTFVDVEELSSSLYKKIINHLLDEIYRRGVRGQEQLNETEAEILKILKFRKNAEQYIRDYTPGAFAGHFDDFGELLDYLKRGLFGNELPSDHK